jgi:1-phosphofructokinase
VTVISAKILTLTANPAIDSVLEVNHLSLGETLLAQNSHRFAAGKGLNVAKAVASLNHPVQACGFVGNESAAFFQALNSALIQTSFILVNGENRTNITLTDKASGQETHIRTAGFSVKKADCQNLRNALTTVIQKGDIVVFSGSLPQGAPADFYQTLISLCHEQDAIAFLDSSGAALAQGLKAKPDLIKPNKAEFEDLIGCCLTTEAAMVAAAQEVIAHSGVEWIVISLGEEGALMVSDEFCFSAAVKLGTNANIISHVGCGDAMLAGLAVAKLNNDPLPKMLELAVACGTANLFSREPGCFSLKKLAQMLKKVQIQRL